MKKEPFYASFHHSRPAGRRSARGKRGGNGRVVPRLLTDAARAGERELKLSAAAADGIPPAQAAHVTLRAIVETLRTLPPLAVTLRCPDEKTLCAHTVDWNMFYQEEKPE